jgi:hypothetical protein
VSTAPCLSNLTHSEHTDSQQQPNRNLTALLLGGETTVCGSPFFCSQATLLSCIWKGQGQEDQEEVGDDDDDEEYDVDEVEGEERESIAVGPAKRSRDREKEEEEEKEEQDAKKLKV